MNNLPRVALAAAYLALSLAAAPAWPAAVPIGRASTETPAQQAWQVLPLPLSRINVRSNVNVGQMEVAHTAAWLGSSSGTIDALLLFEGSSGSYSDRVYWDASCERHKASEWTFVRDQWRNMRSEWRDDCLVASGLIDLGKSLTATHPETAALLSQQGIKLDGRGYVIRTTVAQNGTLLTAWLFARESFKGSDKPLAAPLGKTKLPPAVVQWGIEMSSAVRASTLSPSGQFVLPRIEFQEGLRPAADETSLALADPALGPPRMLKPSEACSNVAEVMKSLRFPPEAIAAGVTDGTALVEFALTTSGEVNDVETVRMSHPIFAAAAVTAAKRLKCNARTHRVRVQMPFAFHIEN